MIRKRASFSLVLSIGLAGCGSTPGAKPHDMSVAQHEAAASREEAAAGAHGSSYKPGEDKSQEHCPRAGAAGEVAGPCWTSEINPTAEHLREAEQHRKMAADHRAAAQALRDAEARACAGIAPRDRDTSPFDHREDIESVSPLMDTRPLGKTSTQVVAGAVIVFRAVQGMTAEWLQREVDCHLARNAALGHVVPEMPNCPLVPKGVTARVSSTGSGFAVTVRGEDPETAREILNRAQSLVAK